MAADAPVRAGRQPEFFDAYGITPDEDRIRYYRALWHLES